MCNEIAHCAAVKRGEPCPNEATAAPPWVMPEWMEPYRELIGDTGGNSIEELYNDETTAQQNLIRAALALAVRDQVNLLYRLMHGGHLVNREVFEQVQRCAVELREDGYDELGSVGQKLVDTVSSLEVKG